jgi:ATP synthase protein I
MTGNGPPDSLEDLDERIREAEIRRNGKRGQDDALERGKGLTLALRIGTDLVAALIVGVAIGIGLDYWLGTKPWFLVAFFLLGAAAGMLNVFRTMSGFGYAAGYRKEGRKDARGTRDKRNG